MNKKDYQKPTMQVVELRHHGMLMTSGGVGAMRSSYGKANNDFSQDELNDDGEWEWN